MSADMQGRYCPHCGHELDSGQAARDRRAKDLFNRKLIAGELSDDQIRDWGRAHGCPPEDYLDLCRRFRKAALAPLFLGEPDA